MKAIAPKYAELAASFPHVQFLRVDVDKQQAIAAKYEISAMPTFLAIVDGEVKDTVCNIHCNCVNLFSNKLTATRCRSTRLGSLGK